jgi:transcriptional regulator with XRE-family HTH domain
MSPAQAFGAALKEMRMERGLSQEGAALASGIDRAYFGKLERADKVPTLTTVWKIATAFEVQPSELLGRAEKLLHKL